VHAEGGSSENVCARDEDEVHVRVQVIVGRFMMREGHCGGVICECCKLVIFSVVVMLS
jgi:hypothetical protein